MRESKQRLPIARNKQATPEPTQCLLPLIFSMSQSMVEEDPNNTLPTNATQNDQNRSPTETSDYQTEIYHMTQPERNQPTPANHTTPDAIQTPTQPQNQHQEARVDQRNIWNQKQRAQKNKPDKKEIHQRTKKKQRRK